MAYYAFLDENYVVTDVITGKDEGNFDWETYYGMQRGQLCRRTSYNTHGGVHYDPATNQPSPDQSKAFRKNYATVGCTFDPIRNAFIPTRPYSSWTLNDQTCLWDPPIPYPQDGKTHLWDENIMNWIVYPPGE